MGISDFFEHVADVVFTFPAFVEEVKEINNDFKNDVKVTCDDFRKEMKEFGREVVRENVTKIIHDADDTLDSVFEFSDKVENGYKRLCNAINNPLDKNGTVIKSENELEHGDHIFVDCITFTHHGIYVGDNEVVHFAREEGNELCIHRVSLDKFSDGRAIYKKSKAHSNVRFTGKEVVDRAFSQLYEGTYNLAFNNCEHFARWCRFGD